MKTHILCSVTFFRKSLHLWDKSKNRVETQGATNVRIWHIHVACWISKATHTYVHSHPHAPRYPHACSHRPIGNTAFPLQQWFVNRPHYYIIHTLPLFLLLLLIFILAKRCTVLEGCKVHSIGCVITEWWSKLVDLISLGLDTWPAVNGFTYDYMM